MASRIDYSQNRKLYVGTTAEVTVADGNAIIAGNVGIGTTSPDGKLEIVQNSSGSTPTLIVANYPSGDDGFTFQSWRYNESQTNFRLDLKQRVSSGIVQYAFDMVNNGVGYNSTLVLDRGKVGIGTTSPESKLHVAGGNVLISNGQYYTAESNTGGNYKIATITTGNVVAVGAIDYTSAGTIFAGGDNVSITTGGITGSSRLYIDSSGNVGIGVTTTSYKLEVSGASKISGNVIIGTDPNTYANLTLKDATTASANSKSLFIWSQNSGRSFLSLVTAGTGEAQIGFGTSQYASQNTSGSIQYTQATSKFTFKTNYTLALTIANNQAATFSSTVQASGYKSSDGTAGITGTMSFVDKDSVTRTITYKNGLVVGVTP